MAWSSLSPPRETKRGRAATVSGVAASIMVPGLSATRSADPDLAGQDGAASLGAGREEPPGDEQRVEPLAHSAA